MARWSWFAIVLAVPSVVRADAELRFSAGPSLSKLDHTTRYTLFAPNNPSSTSTVTGDGVGGFFEGALGGRIGTAVDLGGMLRVSRSSLAVEIGEARNGQLRIDLFEIGPQLTIHHDSIYVRAETMIGRGFERLDDDLTWERFGVGLFGLVSAGGEVGFTLRHSPAYASQLGVGVTATFAREESDGDHGMYEDSSRLLSVKLTYSFLIGPGQRAGRTRRTSGT